MAFHVYILRCADGSYYVGSTKKDPLGREWEHNQRLVPGYTHSRTPVVLVYAERHERLLDGFQRERQLKGWSRAKKEALIDGQLDKLSELSKSRIAPAQPSPW